MPRCSMYGIFTYIYPKNCPSVDKYSIHGCNTWSIWDEYSWEFMMFDFHEVFHGDFIWFHGITEWRIWDKKWTVDEDFFLERSLINDELTWFHHRKKYYDIWKKTFELVIQLSNWWGYCWYMLVNWLICWVSEPNKFIGDYHTVAHNSHNRI